MQGSETVALKTCSISMSFDADRLPRALELLLSAAGPTQAKRGCRSCRVERDVGDEGRIQYAEEWDSDEAFVRHVRSEEFLRVLLAMDLCSEEPQVQVGDLAAHYGIDVLHRLRMPGPAVEPLGEHSKGQRP